MRYFTPIVVLALVARLAAAIAVAERVPVVVRVLAEPAVQYQTSGVDREYSHGTWCIDTRSF